MLLRKTMLCLGVLPALLAQPLRAADPLTVPNPSFEDGDGPSPSGWTPSDTACRWLDAGAADGKRAISVTGTGRNDSAWRSADLPFQPSTVYRLRFQARSLGASGGTPVSGPAFCNRDLGMLPTEWTTFESLFISPRDAVPGALRFGQWHLHGTVAFDDVSLLPALPVYLNRDGVALGEGERIDGNAYRFSAPFHLETNHSRPLAGFSCGFNSNRWTLGAGTDAVYDHRIAGRKHLSAQVEVGVTYRTAGALTIEISTDGRDWKTLGLADRVSTVAFKIPREFLPAEALAIRLRASQDANLQVAAYAFSSTLSGPPLHLQGSTRYVSVLKTDPRLAVAIEDLGDALPGGANVLVARVKNATATPLAARPCVTVEGEGLPPAVAARDETLPAGEHVIRLSYRVAGAGRHVLRFDLGKEIRFEARTSLSISDLYSTAYGERLPGSDDRVGLWWASSGWKIGQTRPVPEKAGEALLIRTARNEAEAAQLVVRPAKALKGLVATVDPLGGPGGAQLDPACVDLLKVRYVKVETPTDRTGMRAPWPDPLPPLLAPLDVEAGQNQPLWVRVKPPRDARPGLYRGTIRLRAEGWSAEVPLQVHVFGFALPDRMTCVTAFGFSPSNVWRYQGLETDADRRATLEKYWDNFAAHRISPYDPAPLDPVKVTWPGSGPWEGGQRDATQKHAGAYSLKVADESKTGNVSAQYGAAIPIPEGGLRLRFRYKTDANRHPFIVTLSYLDANGQWMPGRNNDMAVVGSGEWQTFERTIGTFPPGARAVRLGLWAAAWADDGTTTGTVWYDDVSLQDAHSGRELLEGGDFEPLAPERLVPSFDWTAWDAAMTRAIDRRQFNSFRLHIPGLGGGTFHERYEPSLLGFPENTPQYRAAFANYLGAVERHLRDKGWLDEAFAYWFDEPDPKDYAFVMNGFRKLKDAAPGLARMLTEQVEPELVGGPNVWCPVSDQYRHEDAEARRKEGEKFWWYVCTGPKAPYCTLFIDHPATELRVWLWQTWQRKIEGILVWETNYWTSNTAYPDDPQNPYEDPMSWVSGYGVPKGTRQPWGNGDGRFIYPPERAANGKPTAPVLDGPVDSIRWEMLRDGVEDYEYLAMLKRALAEKGAQRTAQERAECEALLLVPESIARSMTSFATDPAPIEQRRLEVAKALERLLDADRQR